MVTLPVTIDTSENQMTHQHQQETLGDVMVKWNTLLVLIVSLLMLTTVQAQQKSTSESTLTPLDYYQIQRQISRASHGFASAADCGNLFARPFTSDGVFV